MTVETNGAPAVPARTGLECPKKVRVMLVEDCKADADLIKGLLAVARGVNFELYHAGSLEQATRRLARGGVDLLLLDLNLPDSAGLDTALRLRAAAPELPLIIMTGLEERSLAVQAMHHGAQDYLFKTEVDGRLLERSIRYAIERQGLMAELNRRFQKEMELGRLKTQLVSVVSHEFANALSVLQCSVDLLVDSEGQGASGYRTHLYEILGKNLRSLNLTAKNLLDMGRLEAGNFTLNLRKVDLTAMAEECLRCLEILYKRKGIRLSVELSKPSLVVKADPDALAFVLSNLLTNAIKYTPERGKIILSVGRDPVDRASALVSVKDTGIGIARSEQKKIFGGYYRSQNGRRAADGFGVGLAFAKTILEAHHSSLLLTSVPRKGSRFFFSLPLWRAGDVEPPVEALLDGHGTAAVRALRAPQAAPSAS